MRIVIGSLLGGLATLAVVVLSGGKEDESATGRGPRGDPETVVAAFYPLAFAAERIAPGAELKNLTPPGAEPHDLELTPQDVKDVQAADLVLLMGEGFQPQLESAAGDGDGVARLLDTPGLELASGDPHVWLDPVRFRVVADAIAGRLGDRRAAEELDDELAGLDREFESGLAECKRREIVTGHEAFEYLADRYGLKQVAISGISPEAEPTPSDLERAAGTVRDTGATTVFSETLVSPKLSETVARETGAETAVLNPIEGLTPAERDRDADYFSVMRENLAALREALDCR